MQRLAKLRVYTVEPEPREGQNGIPLCDSSCGHYDTKKCLLMGIRAVEGAPCEPMVQELCAELSELRRAGAHRAPLAPQEDGWWYVQQRYERSEGDYTLAVYLAGGGWHYKVSRKTLVLSSAVVASAAESPDMGVWQAKQAAELALREAIAAESRGCESFDLSFFTDRHGQPCVSTLNKSGRKTRAVVDYALTDAARRLRWFLLSTRRQSGAQGDAGR